MTSDRHSSLFQEDWLAVGIGGVSIALVLAGVRPDLPSFAWSTLGDFTGHVLGLENMRRTLVVGLALALLSGLGVVLMQGAIAGFAAGFPVVFALAWLAQVLAGSAAVAAWGVEYVIFALGLGLLVSNLVGVPGWLQEAARSEYHIKTGLVMLGAGILFGDLVQAGVLGIAQAVLVVLAVWFVTFWLARRLRVDDELATLVATAVSICGVSAAIAACGAIQGDRKKLSYVTSLVLIVAAPMMVVMPHIVRGAGMPDLVGGAWLGGTLDTSASVVAAGELVSAPARDVGVVVKLSQNALIGVAAFLLTIWWAFKHRGGGASRERPSVSIVWQRFPKFVLGFVAASFVFSFLLDASLVEDTRAVLTGVRTMWFAMAFASIGLETRVLELIQTGGGRPAIAFLGGQAFNIVWTLLLAYLLFGGILFPVPEVL